MARPSPCLATSRPPSPCSPRPLLPRLPRRPTRLGWPGRTPPVLACLGRRRQQRPHRAPARAPLQRSPAIPLPPLPPAGQPWHPAQIKLDKPWPGCSGARRTGLTSRWQGLAVAWLGGDLAEGREGGGGGGCSPCPQQRQPLAATPPPGRACASTAACSSACSRACVRAGLYACVCTCEGMLCVRVYTCACAPAVYRCACTRTCVHHARSCTHGHACVPADTHPGPCGHACVRVFTCTSPGRYACVHVHMYLRVPVSPHTCVYANTSLGARGRVPQRPPPRPAPPSPVPPGARPRGLRRRRRVPGLRLARASPPRPRTGLTAAPLAGSLPPPPGSPRCPFPTWRLPPHARRRAGAASAPFRRAPPLKKAGRNRPGNSMVSRGG